MKILLTLVSLSVFPLLLRASAPESAHQYENPVIRGMNPDPSVVRVGSDYYLVTSTMFFYPGCPIYHSKDLIHWRRIGYALTRASQFSLQKNHGHPMMYAATLRYHNGTFYLITTDVAGGGNFYVTATNPAGPWSDPIYIDGAMFDPSLMFDDDGKVYYTRRGDFKNKDIVQAEIDIGTGKLLTPLRSIAKGMVSDDAEGPHLYRIGGWYYVAIAEGGSRFLHMETIGRSKSPWGPFAPCPHNPWLAQHHAWWDHVKSIGHADLVDTPDGKWWAVFLGTRHYSYPSFSIGRETFLVPVTWQEGWPSVKPADEQNLSVHEKTLPLEPWPVQPTRDDFDARQLGLEWTLLAYPTQQTYSLSERPGFLRLKGQPENLLPGTQAAFVGLRQTEWGGSAAARLEFAPAQDNEEAGVTVFTSGSYHYEIFKTLRGGKPRIALRKTVGDISTITASVPLPNGPVLLKIEADPENYTFSYAAVGGPWQVLGKGLTRLLASEVADVWSGVLFGMYSSGNGVTSTRPADFDWFDYQPSYVAPKD